MSSLLNKAKDALGKSGSSSGSGNTGGGQQSGIEKGVSGQAHTRMSLLPASFAVHLLTQRPTEIDNLTDRAGLGDKYDDKINKFADGQINNQIPGGAGNNAGGSSGGLGGLGK